MFELAFIKKWIDKGYISHAMWRLLELWIYGIIGYVLSIWTWWEAFSSQALISAFTVPVMAYMNKSYRDKIKTIK